MMAVVVVMVLSTVIVIAVVTLYSYVFNVTLLLKERILPWPVRLVQLSGNVGGSEVGYGFVTCNKSNSYRPKQTMIILIEVRGDGNDDGLGKKGGDNEELLTPVSRMGMVVA